MIGLPGTAPAADTCSRAGCRESARWRVDWRNPRIHDESRVKTWLACDEHVEYLRDFLASRSFPVAVAPFDPTVAAPGRPAADPIDGGAA
ncbi:hypothetical protein [Agromyces sp. LHK192]|uniref:hypothetical protein n=1 Tax=Agromyces sp. LHK192 TaxID=2498704 RepID=UPI001F0C225E|nr:hypothetical protein [Agromyces sp. LHK192]